MTLGVDKDVYESNGLTEAQWKKKNPVERIKMRYEYRNKKTSADDPSGQKTLHNEAQKRSAGLAMDNLVKKGKMTEEDKNKKLQTPQNPLPRWNDLDDMKPKEQEQKQEPKPAAKPSAKPDVKPSAKQDETDGTGVTGVTDGIKQKEQEPFTPEEREQTIKQVEQMGITQDSSPEEAMNAFLQKSSDEGLIDLKRDGSWTFRPYDSKAALIVKGIGSLLSVLLSIASGGASMPINFYARTEEGQKDKENSYDILKKNFYDTLATFQRTDAASAYSEAGGAEKAKEAEKVLNPEKERSAELEKDTIMLNFNNAKEMARFQNELTRALLDLQNELGKDIANYNASLSAEQIVKELRALKKSGYTMTEIAEIIRAKTGVSPTQATLDRINQAAGIVGTVVSAVTASDGRFKKFKPSYKKHEYVKDRK